MFNFFHNFFQKPFGLDISDFSIEVISLSGNRENPKLLALGRIELPSGTIADSKILNKKNLGKLLRDLIEKPKFGIIKTKEFIFSLPESKSFIHTFKIPEDLAKAKISDFVKTQASQFFPFTLTEMYFDFKIENDEILVVAVPKSIVNDYLEVFKNCQLKPIALEIESLSLERALIEEKELILLIDIGAKMTNLSLFDEKKLKLSISNPIAGDKLTQAISEKLKIPPIGAEKVKREIGLDPEKEEGRVLAILQEKIQGLIKEIREIEEYYLAETGEKIEKIILAGGSANLPFLVEYLSENLEKKVEIGDPWAKINIDILSKKEYLKEALEIEPVLYSTAIGSALRGLEKDPEKAGINLIKDIKYYKI